MITCILSNVSNKSWLPINKTKKDNDKVEGNILKADFIELSGDAKVSIFTPKQGIRSIIQNVTGTDYCYESLLSFTELERLDSDVVLIDHSLCPDWQHKQQLHNVIDCPLLFFGVEGWQCAKTLPESFHAIPAIENVAQLQQASEMAVFKYRYKQRVSHQVSYLSKALECIGETLIYLDNQMQIIEINDSAQSLFNASKEQLVGQSINDALRVSRSNIASQFKQFIDAAIKTRAVTKIQPTAFTLAPNEQVLFDGLVGPFSLQDNAQGAVIILRKMDVLEEMPQALSYASELQQGQTASSHCVLLINPDDFKQINEKFGWQQGDLILQEIESRLQDCLPATDFSCRYSGAFFLVVLNDTNDIDAINIINMLRREICDKPYLRQQAKLTFSFGFALNNKSLDYSLLELFYHANTSLSKAIEFGGNQIEQWQQPTTLQQIGNFDRIHGGFLQQGNINYRQMLTLWELLNNIDSQGDLPGFVHQLNPILHAGLSLQSSAFYLINNQQIQCLGGEDSHVTQTTEQHFVLTESQQQFALRKSPGFFRQASINITQQGKQLIILVLINIDDSYKALLKLEGEELTLDSVSSQSLLHKLADFIRVSLQKIKLQHAFGSENQQRDEAKASDFWFVSKEMETLMHDVSMVASTEATVLITGESGTGKEFLAKKIHDLSHRSHKPFIIFDCSTVVENLLESELFGHKKGAFTGADKAADGCIKQAQGGTLFLDEVGELSLETQMKLLRFIQEKQYSPVGTSTYHVADVRIISATNVNLQAQMRQGKFREDLYYRLNVFNVNTPPLRKRQEDILLLASKFLVAFCAEYNKHINSFDIQAQVALTQYEWPGNVRELKNVIHKAVILCNQNRLLCSHLGLYPNQGQEPTLERAKDHGNLQVQSAATEQSFDEKNRVPVHHDEQQSHHYSTPDAIEESKHNQQPLKDTIEQLLLSFSQQRFANCDAIMAEFEFKLYKQALALSQDITLQAAKHIGISESTFRRRWPILKNKTLNFEEEQSRMIDSIVDEVMKLPLNEAKPQFVKQWLIETFTYLNIPAKICARMLEVSTPTYRKLAKKVNETNNPTL